MKPFILPVERLRAIYGAKAAHLSDEQMADLAMRMAEIADVVIDERLAEYRAHAARVAALSRTSTATEAEIALWHRRQIGSEA